jgi:orotate phosphoribosyltransferase
MLEASIFNEVGRVLFGKLKDRNINQIAGFGYGAFPVVCAVLGSTDDGSIRGGFIREKRKTHGRQRRIEGPIHPSHPVVLLDDILNSGQSAERAVYVLREEGFRVEGCMTLFNFTWGGGKARLERLGVWVDTLLDINLREPSSSYEPVGSDVV